MSTKEILQKIKELPAAERLYIVERTIEEFTSPADIENLKKLFVETPAGKKVQNGERTGSTTQRIRRFTKAIKISDEELKKMREKFLQTKYGK